MKDFKILGVKNATFGDTGIGQPNLGQVKIKVAYVGICGSDLHYFYNGENGAFKINEPLTPGHEMSGYIEQDPLGELKIGTPVTVHPATFGNETSGLEDKPHLWPSGGYLGSASTHPHTQGALCEFILVDRKKVRVLPNDLDIKTAALAEPLSVALHAINISGGVNGKSVLVSGAGPIGLLVIAACKILGAKSIAVSDIKMPPLNLATYLGADTKFLTPDEVTPTESFDLVFECSGSPLALSSALNAVNRSGVVIQVGMLPSGFREFNISPLVSKEVQLRGTFRFNQEIDSAILMLSKNKLFNLVIGSVYKFASLDEIIAAFHSAKSAQTPGKVLISLLS